jgi:outer membrane protein assembly factor BamA
MLVACAPLVAGQSSTQPTTTTTAQGVPGLGLPITRLVLRTDLNPRNVDPFRDLLHLERGDTLTPDTLRRALLVAHATGLFAEIEAHTRLDREGVEVTLAGLAATRIESVAFSGDSPLSDNALRTVTEVRRDAPLIEAEVLRSDFALEARLEEEGHLEAAVIARVRPGSEPNLVRVIFEIEAGPRATIGAIEFRGELEPVTADELRGAMASRMGERFWPQRVQRDSDTLRRYLQKREFRQARVRRPVVSYDAATARVDLEYEVERGPVIDLEVHGVSREFLESNGVLPFLGPQGFDPALVRFSEARTRSFLQSRGYYYAWVEGSERVEPGRTTVVMEVELGERFELQKILFEGVEQFETDRLLGLMATTERRPFSPDSGRLVDGVLDVDLRNLASFYRMQGFGEVVVGPAEVSERHGGLVVTIPVAEGPRRLVGTLGWHGVEAVAIDRLKEALPLREGGPFHPTRVEQATNAVRAFYRDRGFDQVLVSAEVTENFTTTKTGSKC